LLGRHAILLLWRALTALEGEVGEPIVFDHFETFELTQDLPLGVATPLGAPSPARRPGLTDRPWRWERVLARRLFPHREKLRGTWLELHRRDWTTPELPSNVRHRRIFAY